jgi:hypothetical protein
MLIPTLDRAEQRGPRRVFDPDQRRHRQFAERRRPWNSRALDMGDDAAGLLGPRLGGMSRTRRRAERRAGLKQIALASTWLKGPLHTAPPSTVGLSHTPVRGPPLHRTLRLRNGLPCRSGGVGHDRRRPEHQFDKIGSYCYTFLLTESPPAGRKDEKLWLFEALVHNSPRELQQRRIF